MTRLELEQGFTRVIQGTPPTHQKPLFSADRVYHTSHTTMPHDGHSFSPRKPQTYLVCLMPSSSVNTSFCTKFRRPSLFEFLSAPNPVIGVPTRADTSWCCFTISNASVNTPLGLRRLGTEGGAEMAGGCMSVLWIACRDGGWLLVE